jgi:TetR/AcrR family transcriptional regulator, tetracycline repressor protein
MRRADVLAAALRLLDAEGLDGITMRRLAGSLDLQPSALYHHFRDKKALIDALAEQLLADVGDVDPAQPWDERIESLALQVRSALMAHRDGGRLMAGTFVAQPNTLRIGERHVEALRDAGLDQELWATTTFTLNYYILGHTIEEQARDELIAAGTWDQQLVDLAKAPYPVIARAVTDMERLDGETRFRRGLDLIIDGIRTAVNAGAGRDVG